MSAEVTHFVPETCDTTETLALHKEQALLYCEIAINQSINHQGHAFPYEEVAVKLRNYNTVGHVVDIPKVDRVQIGIVKLLLKIGCPPFLGRPLCLFSPISSTLIF